MLCEPNYLQLVPLNPTQAQAPSSPDRWHSICQSAWFETNIKISNLGHELRQNIVGVAVLQLDNSNMAWLDPGHDKYVKIIKPSPAAVRDNNEFLTFGYRYRKKLENPLKDNMSYVQDRIRLVLNN